MRLLRLDANGRFSLTKDLIDNIPPYAILSHTWGDDDEEVTFIDLEKDSGKAKSGTVGYRKIQFCGEQAARDQLKYFWVDTCCINKSNNAELSEAINSMFRWYRSATRCYVYLSDVSSPALDVNDQLSELPFESAFRTSKWFTRGWTLQELLAPSSVEFFSREGNRLGDKRSLQLQIHEITGIPVPALQEPFLSRFGIDERLSWAQNRQTTRKEDQAYALLGIFDVYMPLIYGEGKDNALKRLLKETYKSFPGPDYLPYAVEAPFNSIATQNLPTCLPNTRVELLRELYNWADRQDERCIFWLNGLAGTGKSTISRTVARKWYKEGRLGASFFFSRGGGDVGHAGKFVTSIAVQLVSSVPTIYRFICDAITQHSDITSRSLRDQWRLLVLDPLSKLDSCRVPYILVVDALDECDDGNTIQLILQLLAEARSLQRVQLRVFLTSRPEISIRSGVCQIPDTEHQDFVLHNISPSTVDHDIFIFLEYNFQLIRQERSLGVGWPDEEISRQLVQNACGLFIWAATACRFIREGKRFAAKRLNAVLKGSSSAIIEPEKHLDEIYTTVLGNSLPPEFTDKEKKESSRLLRQILGSIVILFSPLSTHSLHKLLFMMKDDIDQTLEDLHSVIDIPKDQTQSLRLLHPSFRDFLLNNDRCKDLNFWVNENEAHQTLANRCIELMSTSLKQDICGVETPGVLVTSIASSRVEQCLPPEVEYACLYWTQHLQKSGTRLYDNGQVHQFLQVHLLHWLEAISWRGKISEGILAILSLEAQTPDNKSPNLHAFIYDARRFALYNRSVIEQAPLQIYCSALVFAPRDSIIRRQFEKCIPPWIETKLKVQAKWSAALQVLQGHSNWVRSVAFSPDGKLVVSGAGDRTVRLWDAVTGAARQTLEGHLDSVNSVAFSPQGMLVASGSSDKTVRLWDAVTGAARQILKGHSDLVTSIAFSPDSKLVVSGSDDKTVRLWDAVTGTARQTLEGHSDWVISVAFSPNGKLVASGSGDKTVRFWDVITGKVRQILNGHLNWVRSVAFSLDGKLVASGSDDKTVRLWDAVTGAARQTLKGHSDSITSVAFSPDGKLVASGSGDKTVRLWDTLTGAAWQILEGHSDWVTSVAFSPNGKLVVSGADDDIVRLWDAVTDAAQQTLGSYLDSVTSIAFSPDGKLVVSGTGDNTVRLWDAMTGVMRQTLKGHSDFITSVITTRDGKLVASESDNKTVRFWDAVTGAKRQILEGHSDWVTSVTFSPDGKLVVSGADDNTVRLWDAITGAVWRILEGHSDWAMSVAFSPDSKLVVSGARDNTVRLWDAVAGVARQTLKGHSNWVRSVAFSPDGKLVVSGAGDRTVRLWDVVTGATRQTLEGHLDSVTSVAFSLDGKLVASGSGDGTVRLWDTLTGAAWQILEGHSDWVTSVAFSPDGKLVISGSDDNTIRLWDTLTGVAQQTLEGHSDLVRPAAFSSGSLRMSNEWIAEGGTNILWIPPSYRATSIAIWDRMVVLGHSSGNISFLTFKQGPKLNNI